jgi:hypothetical protein
MTEQVTDGVYTTPREEVTLQVNSCAEAEGKYGPQWQLEVIFPWSQYPTRAWVDREIGKGPIQPGDYTCIVEQGKLREGKDPGQRWNFNWRILELKGSPVTGEPAPVVPRTAPRPSAAAVPVNQAADVPIHTPKPVFGTPTEMDLRREQSIQQQVALKAAVDLVVAWIAQPLGQDEEGVDVDQLFENVSSIYTRFTGSQLPLGGPAVETPEEVSEQTVVFDMDQPAPEAPSSPPEPREGADGGTAGEMFVERVKALGKSREDVDVVLEMDLKSWLKANPSKSMSHALSRCEEAWR